MSGFAGLHRNLFSAEPNAAGVFDHGWRMVYHETHEKHEKRKRRGVPANGANDRESDSQQGTEDTKCWFYPDRIREICG
jgi:hypothetical protein